MDTPTQSSFIPQDAASLSSSKKVYSNGGLSDLMVLMSIVLFVASLALAGAVFLYGEYLQTSAASKVDQLRRAKEAFEPSLIHSLTRLDDRMHAADQILSNHIAPSAFFDILEQATLENISFKSLQLNASDMQNITINMDGVAKSVNTIALQADLFSKNGSITNPIFSNIARQNDGVHFSLTALLNPVATNFVHVLRKTNTGEVPVTNVPSQQTPQVTPFGTPESDAQTPPPPPPPEFAQ